MTAEVVPFPLLDVVTLRRYRPTDVAATLVTFWEAVREGASAAYSDAQRAAWARAAPETASWSTARGSRPTWVAEIRGQTIGFSDLLPNGDGLSGVVDMLYVHPAFTRRGVGKALLDEVERHARELNLRRLRAYASLTAQPLFHRQGFVTIHNQTVELGGQRLAQTIMEKTLEPAA